MFFRRIIKSVILKVVEDMVDVMVGYNLYYWVGFKIFFFFLKSVWRVLWIDWFVKIVWRFVGVWMLLNVFFRVWE